MGFLEDLVRTVQEAAEEARRKQQQLPIPQRPPPPQQVVVVRRTRAQPAESVKPPPAPAPAPVRRVAPAAPPPEVAVREHALRARLRDRSSLAQAVTLAEILAPPLAMRRGMVRDPRWRRD